MINIADNNVKTEYTFEKGTHYSRGKKDQPTLLALIPIVIGIVLQLIHGVSIWYSIACYAGAITMYKMAFEKLLFTNMRVVFDASCIYHINGPDQLDINKLFGLGFGDHNSNSARFGWAANGDKIDVFAYVHNDGNTVSKKMFDCAPNEPIELTLKVTKDNYEFTASKRNSERARTKIERKRTWNKFFIYKLFPYFGGNQVAPTNMRLEMTNIE